MAFRNLDEFLTFQEERMREIGFKADKIDLCLSDIRSGAIELLEVGRALCRQKGHKKEFQEMFFMLEAWVEGKYRQRRERDS